MDNPTADEAIAKMEEINSLDSHGRYGRLAREAIAALRSHPQAPASWEVAGRHKRALETAKMAADALDAAMVLAEMATLGDVSDDLRRVLDKRKSLISTARYEVKTTLAHDIAALSPSAL